MEEKKQFPNRELLVEMGHEDSVVFENPDYREDYDADRDHEAYDEACEERE